MGREKVWLGEQEDALMPLLIDAGIIGECSMHSGCTFLTGSEAMAYAMATNAHKEGQFSVSLREVTEAVKDILTMTPFECAGCQHS